MYAGLEWKGQHCTFFMYSIHKFIINQQKIIYMFQYHSDHFEITGKNNTREINILGIITKSFFFSLI